MADFDATRMLMEKHSQRLSMEYDAAHELSRELESLMESERDDGYSWSRDAVRKCMRHALRIAMATSVVAHENDASAIRRLMSE